ncbi:hypothetical protein ACU4GD_36725 [Cupriavidus basilensis]
MRHLVAVVVPGIGYECFEPWLNAPGTVPKHLREFGYDGMLLKVDALSGSANNARQIRDADRGHAAGRGSAAPGAGWLLEGCA